MKNILCLLFLLTFVLSAQAQEGAVSRESFNTMLEQIKTDEDNVPLRINIIEAVKTLTPPPAIPEDAKKFMARGRAAVKMAKDQKGFMKAAEEFAAAVQSAPWLGDAYYNLALVQDKAGQYSKAITNLEIYLLSAPAEQEAQEAQSLMYEIEYRLENASKAVVQEDLEDKKNREQFFKNMIGRWTSDTRRMLTYYYISVSGDSGLKAKIDYTECKPDPHDPDQTGSCWAGIKEFDISVNDDNSFSGKARMKSETSCTYNKLFDMAGQISEDGHSVTMTVQYQKINWNTCRWTGKPQIFTETWTKY